MVQIVLYALELILEWTERNCFPPIFDDFPSFCSVLEKELFVKVASCPEDLFLVLQTTIRTIKLDKGM